MDNNLVQSYLIRRTPQNMNSVVAPVVTPAAASVVTTPKHHHSAIGGIHIVHSSKGLMAANPKGYLVKENVLDSAVSTVGEYGKSVNYLYKAAIKGEGTDFTVGKINDLTLRLGSLGIATVISASKASPFAKGMEFIGLGSWFGAMALWPQVLGAPIKAFKGVDINQKYVDSYGRRKRFFEDPQYLNWDLFSDEKINKIGDKLGIPKNIENRRGAVQEKMKQIATQGNTLAMLTAGFATPVISSIICDQLQPHLQKAQSDFRVWNTGKKLKDLTEGKISEDFDNIIKAETKIEGISNLPDTIKDVKDIEEIQKAFEKFNGYCLEGIEEQLKGFGVDAKSAEVVITDEFKNKLKTGLGVNDDQLKAILKDQEKITEKTLNILISDVKEHFNGITVEGQDIPLDADMNLYDGKILDEVTLNKKIDSVKQLFNEHKSFNINIKEIENLYKHADAYVQAKDIVENYAKATVNNVVDSQTANQWSKLPQENLKAMGFNSEQIKTISKGGEPAKAEIAKRFMEVADKPEEFKTVVKELGENLKEAAKPIQKAVDNIKQVYSNLEKVVVQSMTAGKLEALKNDISKKLTIETIEYNNKLNNTIASFSSHIKALEVHDNKKLEKKIKIITAFYDRRLQNEIKNLKDKELEKVIENNRQNLKKEIERIKGLYSIAKQIVLSNNGVDNWTNKLDGIEYEYKVTDPATKKEVEKVFRIKNMDDLVKVSEILFGRLDKKTAKAIDNADLVKMINKNNKEMNHRFLSIVNEVRTHMNTPGWNDRKFISINNETILNRISAMVDKHKNNMGNDDKGKSIYENLKNNIIEPIRKIALGSPANDYKIHGAMDYLKDNLKNHVDELMMQSFLKDVEDIKNLDLNIKTPFADLSAMAGKGIDDFFIDAAKNHVGHNKWLKFAGIIGGSVVAVSAIAISQFGTTNNFNPDVYKVKGGK